MKDFVSSRAARELDRRLTRGAPEPLAVAFSGGGDSLALLLAAHAWARHVGRALIALTVDHGLSVESADWAAWCAARAARLGIPRRTLVWTGSKPVSGLPAAARAARHRLIADAAREAGARVILFGHTADDVLEAEAMRAGGVRIATPNDWSPSPVWPEGRGLFIQRPMLGLRRAEIRAFLTDRGETWIDDPANSDTRHPRVRARTAIGGGGSVYPAQARPLLTPTASVGVGPAADVTLSALLAGSYPEFVAQLGAAVVCASGGERPPRSADLDRLIGRLASGDTVDATLGGARVARAKDHIHVAREIGDSRGRACAPLTLPIDEWVIWDGRFEVRAQARGLMLAALAGHAARLGKEARERVARLHPIVRRALPALTEESGAASCPTLISDPRIGIRNLVPARMDGACGLIETEADLDRRCAKA